MKSPEDKAVGYTVVVVICAIVVWVVISVVGGLFVGAGMMGSAAMKGAMLGSMRDNAAPEVQFDKNSALGKLQEFGKKMEESGKKVEAAEKSGDPNAAAKASMEMLGAVLGGGKRVDPISVEQAKSFIPDSFAGLPKQSSKAERNGIAGLMIAKAEASYGDSSGKRVTLEVSDTGGMSGLMGLASWAGVQGEKEDQYGSEKTQNVNGRLVHEKISKSGGSNEFGMVIGDRFIVDAKGNVDLGSLKAAVAGLDLGRLESLKDTGVQK